MALRMGTVEFTQAILYGYILDHAARNPLP
jgi:hypothetical protein